MLLSPLTTPNAARTSTSLSDLSASPTNRELLASFPCVATQYTSANNAARRETYEEAVALDTRTWDAWHATHAHAHTHISGVGDTSLEAKLDALVAQVRHHLGQATSPAMTGGIPTLQATEGDASISNLCSSQSISQVSRTAGVAASASLEIPSSAPTTVAAPRLPPQPKRRQWYLPPQTVVALADTVAAAPDLSLIAPTAISILRRTQRIDARVGRAADRRAMRPTGGARGRAIATAEKIGKSSGLERPDTEPDSPLVF